MGTDKRKQNILDLFDKLEIDLLRKNTSYAEDFLKERDLDIVAEKEYASQYLKKVEFMTRAVEQKSKDQDLIERAVERIKDIIEKNSSLARDGLIALLESKAPAVQFRKLENWTEDEIREVITDVNLIELLEELDNK